jgi:hypothetical protein
MRLLELQFWTSFVARDGKLRELKDPEAPATPRQLRRLNEAGMLAVVEPGEATSIRKGQAAYAVSLVAETPDPESSSAWGFR